MSERKGLEDPSPNSAFESSPRTVIYAEILLHGPASQPPTTNGVVLLQGGKIMYVGSGGNPALVAGASKVYSVKCCMPGMWDVHSHFLGAHGMDSPHYEMWWKQVFEDRAVKVGRDVPRLAKIIESGFTSVREVGGLGKHLKVLVEEGSIIGPRIYHANSPIHITGGHCDMPPEVPLQCLGSLCSLQDPDQGGLFGPGTDGPSECVKKVRGHIRAGASVIKLCCSGGVMSQTLGLPTQPQFSPQEIQAMTEEAARHDRLVCAHCHAKQGIINALNNGVRCIEHFTLADDPTIELALQKDALVVPTRWVIERLVGPDGIDGPRPSRMSEVSWNKLKLIYKASIEAHTKAIAAGVKIATGCDIFYAEGYGTSAKELEYLVNLGMTPEKAIEAATVHGALSLGEQAPLTGQLKSGYDADVICLDFNPLENIKGLQDTDRIKLVFKGGVLQKDIF